MDGSKIAPRLSRAARFLAVLALFASEAAAQQHFVQRLPAQSLLARESLAAHNSVRSRIGVPPLIWSEQMARLAQNWADTLLASGAFEHRRNNRFGENLFECSGFDATPFQVVNAWASEARNYQYFANTCSGVCGHYTQVVWRDTKAVGCGMARNSRRQIWVCNYTPFGNIVGERPY